MKVSEVKKYAVDFFKRVLGKIKIIVEFVQQNAHGFLKCISNFFRSTILLWALAYFVPELRAELPSLYQLIDIFMDIIEAFFGLIM